MNYKAPIPKQTREEVIARDKRTCQYCGKAGLYKRRCTLDHLNPESKGGEATPSNLVVACHACNHRKGKKSLEDYIAWRELEIQRELETLSRLKRDHA